MEVGVLRASLVAQMVKRLPAMRETQVRFLGQEDPLEKEMAIHSSTLAWKIPWMEEPDRLYSPWGCKESDTTERLDFLSWCSEWIREGETGGKEIKRQYIQTKCSFTYSATLTKDLL